MHVVLQPVALLCALIAVALGASARAAECTQLAAAASAPDDADTAWAAGLFEAIVDAQRRVDPSATRPALRILSGTSEVGAWYCPSRDSVFIARALITYAALARASDGADFLAFALAHELAHRRFDAAVATEARPLAADRCAASAMSVVEAAADQRAVFLLALAKTPDGQRFAPFALAHYQSLETFLASELGVSRECPAFRARSLAIQRSLGRLTDIAALYEAARAVAFQPDGLADLAAITAALAPDGPWDAVPELSVLRAHAAIAAATRGGWCPDDLAVLGLAACRDTCVAIFPSHARLAPPDDPRWGVRRTPAARAAALAAARRALADARRQGMTAAELGGAEACLAFAQRDPAAALAALASVPAHPATDAARAADRRIFERQRALLESADPTVDAVAFEPIASQPYDTRALAERVAALACDPAHDCLRLPTVELATLDDTTLGAWQSACEVSQPGLADDGAALYLARCPYWDPVGVVGWTLSARGDRVVHATRVKRP